MPTYAKNKKVFHDYEVLKTLEAGLMLSGQEVKSVRDGQINLKGSYVTFHKETPMLTNAHIAPYKFANLKGEYEPTRSRTLLFHKKEIAYLRGKIEEKGLTIVPLSVYTKGRHIKVEVAIVKGKKKYDKRQSIKTREQKRETARIMKEHQ
ncbi:MAG: SsrA-binding protein SmpB [Candidatus Magasanikbacteria bacterium]|jgi:SsrA-binding protein|nr:SsrA-binding protein SmpB [Candidatus Magasanikbacteria bacterium]MBT4220839.1 SsrA-binding protein SmpB [Candidatus Magasanikbacteria bacterium]MBT4350184.1 SsrA-binding protein SmpB [Candidatus Magasanikbacteria bacterium]MBT4541373.1 SsrA-binding protein SmpB [Candidatus Magasanikbacteria bacterium]MBT6253187.1 SsrA-binding protein SmpB [Candidatus Magasanikbacteria bacterium]